MTLRVVNLGLPKSGTTTLAKALRHAGMRVADHRIHPHQTKDSTLHGAFVAKLLYEGHFDLGDPGARLQEFEGLSEISLLQSGTSLWPQMDFTLIEALRAHHPGIRFVASFRDAFDLSQSMLAWSNLGLKRLPKANVTGLPSGYGDTTKARTQWIEGHYANLRRWFHDDPSYLELDVSDPDAPAKLGAHLGVTIPWWGSANVNLARQMEQQT